jgi:hypothetical protein
MRTREFVVSAVGFIAAAGAIVGGIQLGIDVRRPGENDPGIAVTLMNMLPLLILGYLLASLAFVVSRLRSKGAIYALAAAAAILVGLVVYVAVDIGQRAVETDEKFFSLVMVLGYLAPVCIVLLALVLVPSGSIRGRLDQPLLSGLAVAIIILTAALAVWMRENRSYDMSGNWWFFLSVFAWGGGWGLALLAAIGRDDTRIATFCTAGGVLLVLFAVLFAIDADGSTRGEPWLYLGRQSAQILGLGLIVLSLSRLRLGIAGIAAGALLVLISVLRGLELSSSAVPGFQDEEIVFLREAAIPIALGVIIVLLNETRTGTRSLGPAETTERVSS